MPYLTTQQHHLHYTTTGSQKHPSILLLHGFLGSQQDFLKIVSGLSDQFYCITPDLPGHGKTQTSEGGYTFEATAQVLLSLLNDLNINQTHLLGYSMGGRLTLYLTCSFPNRFGRVVLESASPGLKTAEERQTRVLKDEAIAHQLETTALSLFLMQWYNNPLFVALKQYPQVHAAMLHRRRNNNRAELAKALRGLSTGRQPSLWQNLSTLQCPCLFLVGALDTKFVAINQKISLQCSSNLTTLTIFDGCDHNLHLLAPKKYVQVVRDFLLTATP